MKEREQMATAQPTIPVNAKRSLLTMQNLLLVLVFALGLAIRLYHATTPPLDFHATRQLRSAVIARSVYYQLDRNADPALRQEAVNLAGLEIYEPPILETLVGVLYWVTGTEQLWLARLVNAFFWAIGGLALYFIGRRFAGFWTVLTGLAFYFFLPFSVIATRSFQPDPWMVMWVLLTAWAALRWSETASWQWAILSGLAGGMTLLVKTFAGFYVGPILLAVAIQTLGLKRFLRSGQVWAMAGLSLLPTALYLLLNGQRSSDFISFWVVSLSGLILTTNFYADWLAMLKGLMSLGTALAAVLGVCIAPKPFRAVLFGGWIGYVLFGLVFPYQYTTHEYYHLMLVPLVALSVMPVLQAVFDLLKGQHLIWRLGAFGVVLFASAYALWTARSVIYVQDYELEPASWARVGADIPEGHSFIALTADYGMRLRYYGWRSSGAAWPSSSDLNLFSLTGNDAVAVEDYFVEATQGKDFFVVTALSELEGQPALKEILDGYPLYVEGNGYLIYDLRE
jgi:4-amino-4-deoxy-L-arabinose transferase-like glycosyltransferase